jgi:diadenosine tetraphosphate (Ap4A) HIT family hydrolase
VRALAGVEKLNVAALGNVVTQLHIHVLGRAVGDPAWPGPVWGAGDARAYAPDAAAALIAQAGAALIPSPLAGEG